MGGIAKGRKRSGGGDVDSAALQKEALIRAETDSYLQSQIDILKGLGSEGLVQEILDRIAGDDYLQNQVNNLTTTLSSHTNLLDQHNQKIGTLEETSTTESQQLDDAQTQITALSDALTQETQTRAAADQLLQGQIDQIVLNYPDTTALTDLIKAEEQARIGADTTLQTQIDEQDVKIGQLGSTVTGLNNTVQSHSDTLTTHTNKISTLETSQQSLITSLNDTNERVTILEETVADLNQSGDPVIDCIADVQVNMLVYIGPDGIARPARADSIATMPARFFVTGKPTTGTCSVTKAILKSITNDTAAGKTLFVSETVAGGIQITPPTEPGSVLQPVGEGLSSDKRYYSISDRVTVRA